MLASLAFEMPRLAGGASRSPPLPATGQAPSGCPRLACGRFTFDTRNPSSPSVERNDPTDKPWAFRFPLDFRISVSDDGQLWADVTKRERSGAPPQSRIAPIENRQT
jgi:hypothetical protein